MNAILHLAGSLKEKSIALVGFGVSNLGVAKFLQSKQIGFVIRDKRPVELLGNDALELQNSGVPFFCGDNYLENLSEEIILRAPGIRPDIPAFQKAKKNGSMILTESALFLEWVKSPVFAVTGSDGKTTSTTLVARILSAVCKRTGIGNLYLGGNIGKSLLPEVEKITADDFSVLELSSFQLFDSVRSAEYALVTNLSPNHLNWHKDFTEYQLAKRNLFSHPQNRLLVANAEDPLVFAMTEHHPAQVSLFSSVKHRYEEFTWLGTPGMAFYERDGFLFASNETAKEKLLNCKEFLLPGRHNLENLLGAIALTYSFATPKDFSEAVKDFYGVRHRLEFVKAVDGVAYYNSSIDSTPTRTQAALSALPKKPIVICGGYDKNIPFAPLAKALCQKAKSVILTGAAADKIQAAIKLENPNFPILKVSGFKNAVLSARAAAKRGDIVLLSPACASFDEFANFEERGNTFCNIVEEFSSTP